MFEIIILFVNGAILVSVIPELNISLKIILGIVATLDFMFVIYLLGKHS